MSARNEETGEEILVWKANEMPEKSAWQYHFTNFVLNLNHLPESLSKVIAPTDSRLRPDQRALENGDLQTATIEK
jgi:hypothetical protein